MLPRVWAFSRCHMPLPLFPSYFNPSSSSRVVRRLKGPTTRPPVHASHFGFVRGETHQPKKVTGNAYSVVDDPNSRHIENPRARSVQRVPWAKCASADQKSAPHGDASLGETASCARWRASGTVSKTSRISEYDMIVDTETEYS